MSAQGKDQPERYGRCSTTSVSDRRSKRTNILLVTPDSTGIYLGVRISLYCSFSTLVVAATDMGITMLLMSKELSPRLLLMGCCWGTQEQVNVRITYTKQQISKPHVSAVKKTNNYDLIIAYGTKPTLLTQFQYYLFNDIFRGCSCCCCYFLCKVIK